MGVAPINAPLPEREAVEGKIPKMAQSYDRRINLYINIDGKQVQNNVKSIRAEMLKIVNAQKLMTIGSQEYNLATQKIKQLNGVLAQHSEQVREVQRGWSMKGMADGFNRYMGMITAFAASATGLVIGFKQIIQTFNDYEERVDNLSALTGLAGENLEWLSNKAKELSTSTLEGGIRVTQSAQEIIDAFTKTGSARPELLKNKEALVATTVEAIILADASKTELQPAIEALTMVMNQYNAPATEARRIINALAAGSKEGAGEIPYLTAAVEKAGTVAADANIPIETLFATIETLAPRITQPEIAGRSLKGVLLDLQNGADDTNPAIVGLSTALENLGNKNLTVTELTKKFGVENITTAKILIDNVAELKNFEKSMTGTNVAIEQAAINTDNNNAKLAQAKNRLNVMSIELGEKLAPALQISTNGLSYFIKGLTATIDFLGRHKVLIVSTISAIIAYATATKIATVYQGLLAQAKARTVIVGNLEVSMTIKSILLGKLEAMTFKARFAAVSLYNAGVALLSGNTKKAAMSFRAFNAVLMANPIGLVIGAVVALGTAIIMYSGRMTAAQKATKMLNDVNLEAQQNIVEEKLKIETLLDLAKDEKLSKLDRFKAITQLNQISPKYLGTLTLENINTKAATESVKAYTDSLLENARAQAAREKLAEIDKKILEAKSGEIGFWDKARAGGLMYAAGLNFIGSTEAKNAKASNKAQEDLIAQREKLIGVIKDQAVAELLNPGGGKTDPGAQDLIKLKEKELADAQAIIATTPAEVAARNKKVEAIQKEISALNELGTTKQGESGEKEDDKVLKKRIELIEAQNNAEMAAIKKRHLEGKTSEDQYNAELLMQEMKFLADKAKVYKVGSKEYEEAQMQLLEKQVAAEKTVKDLLLKAQQELAVAKIDNLKDGIEKEKALQEQRFKEEIEALKKQQQDKLAIYDTDNEETKKRKQEYNDSIIGLNDTLTQTIEQKTAAHLKAMADLDKAGALQKQMDAALIAEAKARSDEENFAAQRQIAQAQYEKDVIDAQGNAVLIAQAQRRLSDELIRIKQDERDKRETIGNAIFSAANSLFGGLAELVGKETALGKALFLFQQAAAIGQIIFSTAMANAKAVETFWMTGGMPWVAINTAAAAGSIASIMAQTIAGFSGGGYTGSGNKNEVAGQVHKGEYVIPKKILDTPLGAAYAANLEAMRTNPVTVTQAAVQASKSNRSSGGDSASSSASTGSASGALPERVAVEGGMSNEIANKLIDVLENWDPYVSIELLERRKNLYNKITKGGLKG